MQGSRCLQLLSLSPSPAKNSCPCRVGRELDVLAWTMFWPTAPCFSPSVLGPTVEDPCGVFLRTSRTLDVLLNGHVNITRDALS
ncbi:hypothetical protein BaRGS_00026858 [Batillaria attramentaria]|uniref:Secreted protein n=1 Tax=Batillaria attramentaria TaxID=370345 RepID=A0ABD0K4T0_9CAEN